MGGNGRPERLRSPTHLPFPLHRIARPLIASLGLERPSGIRLPAPAAPAAAPAPAAARRAPVAGQVAGDPQPRPPASAGPAPTAVHEPSGLAAESPVPSHRAWQDLWYSRFERGRAGSGHARLGGCS